MEELMIKIDNVTKQYRLGQIGGTTLRDEMQRLNARIRHKEDPTKKIGAKDYNRGETFMALNGVSFEVKKGERVGIIGHNGAGKSTLLKLLSRVTAPTSGEIGLNGRVASMLEVGTGFHGELTGRENIYMNGAILGMTKKEIDAKIEDIIEFSECRQFIDTPVKRYSSGMYVKLAFSVAAHLDSEIMIMDEVLAVGDMAFQQKCLDKMNDVSRSEGRTILYVSHNMNTIRQLCDRVVVLDHGTVIFDGDVEEGIEKYNTSKFKTNSDDTNLGNAPRDREKYGSIVRLSSFTIDGKNTPSVMMGENLPFSLSVLSKKNDDTISLRIMLYYKDTLPVCMTSTKTGDISLQTGENEIHGILDTCCLAPGSYWMKMALYSTNEIGYETLYDVVDNVVHFQVVNNLAVNNLTWNHSWWGHIMMKNIQIQK